MWYHRRIMFRYVPVAALFQHQSAASGLLLESVVFAFVQVPAPLFRVAVFEPGAGVVSLNGETS